MAKLLKNTINLGGHVITLWSFVPAAAQTAITAGLSAVTAYFGYQELGVARAIFLATGVMAFGMTVTFLWFRLAQIVGTFQRLTLLAFTVPNAAIDAQHGKVKGINVQCLLRNDSQMMMFYRLKRAHNSFERIGPKGTSVERNVVPISPGGTATINLATIEDIPFPDKKTKRIEGEIEMEVEYGSAIDDLRFLLHYTTGMQVAFSPLPNSKEFRIDSANTLKIFEHSKA